MKVQLLNPSEEKSLGLKEKKHRAPLSFYITSPGSCTQKVKPSSVNNKHTRVQRESGGGGAGMHRQTRNFYCAVYYVPGEQQGGACAQWADEMNGQFPSLVVGESEANLNVFQTADELRSSPAGIHALAEHQLVPDVSAGLTSRGDAG